MQCLRVEEEWKKLNKRRTRLNRVKKWRRILRKENVIRNCIGKFLMIIKRR